ncbi:MAG: hypothetical protein IJ043_10430 [Clostridia bacterium]|nr:hypothetical protein [Clostridia bacterium]
MKKIILSILLLIVLCLTACHKTPAPEDKGYDSFREQSQEMTVEDAETLLQQETAQPTDVQYKEAVYTVNENTAAQIIAEAQEKETTTPKLKEVFEGICFKFLEGEDFADPVIKQKLFIKGNYVLEEDGWYHFTFIDRTLAQNAVNLTDNDHALAEYTAVIELLLSDPNVTVKANH